MWSDEAIRYSADLDDVVIDLRFTTPALTAAGDGVVRGELPPGDDHVIDLDGAGTNGDRVNGDRVNGDRVNGAKNGDGDRPAAPRPRRTRPLRATT